MSVAQDISDILNDRAAYEWDRHEMEAEAYQEALDEKARDLVEAMISGADGKDLLDAVGEHFETLTVEQLRDGIRVPGPFRTWVEEAALKYAESLAGFAVDREMDAAAARYRARMERTYDDVFDRRDDARDVRLIDDLEFDK
jgi:hypothetical protein